MFSRAFVFGLGAKRRMATLAGVGAAAASVATAVALFPEGSRDDFRFQAHRRSRSNPLGASLAMCDGAEGIVSGVEEGPDYEMRVRMERLIERTQQSSACLLCSCGSDKFRCSCLPALFS